MVKYKGYHTTHRISGLNILKTKKFKCSDKNKEWLGKGVYFWHNEYTASNFWPKARKIENSMVLEADLFVNEEQVLDLDEEDQLTNFVDFCEALKKELVRSEKYIPLNNEKEKWCFYSNYFKERYRIALIRRTFTASSQVNIYPINRLQYCVSNEYKDEVIQNIKEVV